MSTHYDTLPVQASAMVRLRRHPVCMAIDHFLRTPWYFLVIGALTLLSAMFSLELVTYTCFIAIAIFVALLGRDLLPLTPLIVLSYIAPSVTSNPGVYNASVFSGSSGIYLLCIAGIFVLCLCFRLCTDRQIGRKAFLSRKRSLLFGMLILGAAYMLGGAFSGYYTANLLRNLLFAFIQFLSVILFYYLFTGGIQWPSVPKAYLAWTGLCFGAVIFAEILHIYHVNQVLVGGQIDRDRIFSGWGNCNNMGTMLAIAIPFVFWLACNSKRIWLYEIIALAFMGGVVLSCSRGSILMAAAVYIICYVVLFCRRVFGLRGCLVRLGILFGLILTPVLLYRENIVVLFESLLSRGWESSERQEIYAEGMKQFWRFPVFGGTFYPTEYIPFDFSMVQSFSNIFPPRWHNTFVQILACCGSVGLSAYIFHRIQTIRLLLHKPNTAKFFIGLSLFVLLGASMVDCHFFNIGPTLFYSASLAFAEKITD
ncbi:MAG: hypothetical protein E7448_04090 [Ruminococcaceae bacterium]|nr:hypothetical protein [Oscillospiraceae bacterium]